MAGRGSATADGAEMMPIQNGRSKEVYTTSNKCWQGEDRLRPTDETMPRNGRGSVRAGDQNMATVRGRGWRRPTGSSGPRVAETHWQMRRWRRPTGPREVPAVVRAPPREWESGIGSRQGGEARSPQRIEPLKREGEARQAHLGRRCGPTSSPRSSMRLDEFTTLA